MCNIFKKQSALLAIFMALAISVSAQTYTDTIKPFSGKKGFRTWSIGINGGVLYPAVAFGGSNNFTNPEITIGYGANIKYQVAHWLAFQFDFLRGKLKGNQDNKLDKVGPLTPGPAFPTYRNVKEFETSLHAAMSLNAVFTLGNVNWLSAKNKVIPYLALGGGIAWYEPEIVTRVGNQPPYTTSAQHLYNTNGEALNHFFVPVGMGLKFNLSRSLNLDLGYKAHYMDADDLD
jgi:OOP family OmpA-OmpF porin